MHPALPDELAETASFMTDYEQSQMWQAAILVADSRGLLMRTTAMFGRRVEGLRSALAAPGLMGFPSALPRQLRMCCGIPMSLRPPGWR